MSRPLRNNVVGGWYHVTSRGHNRRHQQCGSLYQGRFKAVLVEGGGWLLRLSRYIHYNPVAIQGLGMGKREKGAEQKGWRTPTREQAQRRVCVLREYPWSSYRAYAGYEKAVGWLSTATIMRRVKGGREGYRDMTESHLLCGHDEDFWAALKWGFVLGSTKFAESIRAGLKIDRETSGRGCLRRRLDWDQVVCCMEDMKGEPWSAFADKRGDWGRDVTLWAARRLGGIRSGNWQMRWAAWTTVPSIRLSGA
jgi:hypothetical protein